jgi:hypothetical protein
MWRNRTLHQIGSGDLRFSFCFRNKCAGYPVMKRALSRAIITDHGTTVFLQAGGFAWAKEVGASSTVNQTVIRGLVTSIIRYPSGVHSI